MHIFFSRLITTKEEPRVFSRAQNFVWILKYPLEFCSVAAANGRMAEPSQRCHI